MVYSKVFFGWVVLYLCEFYSLFKHTRRQRRVGCCVVLWGYGKITSCWVLCCVCVGLQINNLILRRKRYVGCCVVLCLCGVTDLILRRQRYVEYCVVSVGYVCSVCVGL